MISCDTRYCKATQPMNPGYRIGCLGGCRWHSFGDHVVPGRLRALPYPPYPCSSYFNIFHYVVHSPRSVNVCQHHLLRTLALPCSPRLGLSLRFGSAPKASVPHEDPSKACNLCYGQQKTIVAIHSCHQFESFRTMMNSS